MTKDPGDEVDFEDGRPIICDFEMNCFIKLFTARVRHILTNQAHKSKLICQSTKLINLIRNFVNILNATAFQMCKHF